MLILGIESSCDETSAAVVRMEEDRREILSNIIASQIDIHALYGGVVPEIASRAHIEAISRITYEALAKAGIEVSDLDAVAVANRPGLVGSLLVGVGFAKSLAVSNGIPLVPVHHIHGHIAANYLSHGDLAAPFFALAVSGGHTSLIDVRSPVEFVTVGRTRDDAMGEAFDKIARVMGIPYPGGKEIDRLATLGNPDAIKFPSAAISDGSLDFSFSGLKTFTINYINSLKMKDVPIPREDIAASFTKTAVSSVIKKLELARESFGMQKLAVAGGVAANSHLRSALDKFASSRGIGLYVPPVSLCGDNAAMIASQGYFDFMAGIRADASLNAIPAHDK